jgi:hypothetical protein
MNFKRDFLGLLLIFLLTGCSSLEASKLTLTEEEKLYVKDAYMVTQFTIDVFEGFANSAGEFELGGSSAEEMFGHMIVFSMLEGAIEKLPDTPKQYSHITNELDKALSLFQDGVSNVSLGINNDNIDESKGLEKLDKAADHLVSVEEELLSILKQAGMQKDIKGLQLEAKEISEELLGTLSSLEDL